MIDLAFLKKPAELKYVFVYKGSRLSCWPSQPFVFLSSRKQKTSYHRLEFE